MNSLLTRIPSATRNKSMRAMLAVAVIAAGQAAAPATAATATGTMAISANILDNCTLTVNNLPFGNYVGSTANAVNTTVVANCTLGGLASLSANVGTAGSGTFQRNMINTLNPTVPLPYNLYTTAGRTIVWGDGTNGTAAIPVTGTGAGVTYTIYGNVPTSSVVYPGAYADSVTVTLSY